MTNESESGPSENSEAQEIAALKAENERLRGESREGETSSGEGAPRKGRRWLSIALAVFIALLLPVSILTVWTRNQLLNTDKYVETVEPLASDPAIQTAVADRLTDEITSQLDLESYAKDLLPEKAQPLAGFIAAGGDSLIGSLAQEVVSSEQFEQFWTTANTEAHAALVVLLKGDSTDLLDTANGKVSISLDALAKKVTDGVQKQTGIDLDGILPGGGVSGSYVLFESKQLAQVQTAVKWFDRLSMVLLVLFIASILACIFLAEDRRLGVRRSGLALVVSAIVTLVAMAFVRDVYSSATFEHLQAALNAFDIVTNFLRQTIRAVLAIGVVLVIGAWLFGTTSAATKVRSWGQMALNAADEKAHGRDLGPVPRFIRDSRQGLTWGIVALGVVWLLLTNHPSGVMVLGIAVLCALAIGAIRVVASAAGPKVPKPDSDTPESSAEPADATNL